MRMTMLAAGLVLVGITLMAKPSRAGNLSRATGRLLRSSSYIYVATQRKNGELGSFSPIWFVYEDGKIFFSTSPDSWKAKRIAKGSPLTIRVGSVDGPTLIGKAKKVTDPAYIDKMGEVYSRKYWIAWLGFFRPRSERVTQGKTMAYVVEAEEG